MLLLYTLIFDYLRCKRMHLCVHYCCFFFKNKSITRKRSTEWRVPSAVVHSVWFSLHVKWMAYH
ncbi:hypothetical protein BD408DRAFT_424983 [Parasitella parasitica]|nr:hypothetical protein BD408DRAFT_424983 [Parasitella parasitica]